MPVNNDKKRFDDVKRLHCAYADFLQELENFEKKEKELGKQIRGAIDKDKIHNILKKIVNIKN